MASILVLTADIPYFPGKMGVDFFNLRYLAQRHHVGVVGPVYPQFPQPAVENLRRAVQSAYFWPEELPGLGPNPSSGAGRRLPRALRLLPRSLRRALLHALLGLSRGDHDGLVKLAVLSNLAPYLLKALAEREWDALVIVQSDTRAWLDYLPAHLPLAVYFHDVRSHYLARRAAYEENRLGFERKARRAEREEHEIARRADALGFVSQLDLRRAQAALGPLPAPRVAPIPIDLDYFVPRPAGFERDGRQVVLFTGHLLHPPNIDAALFFLREVWPLVRARHPRAVFQVAGALPADELREACRRAPGVELHADVPDIRPLFWNAAVYVVPMRFGGGVRQKVLEAWAMETPLVLTPMAAEGTPVRDGEGARIARRPEELAERVSELLASPAAGIELMRGTREVVRAAHAIETASAGFEELVRAALSARRARPTRVLLDLAWLVPGDRSPSAEATRALAREMLAARRDYRVLAPRATLEALDMRGAPPWRALASDGARVDARRLRRILAALLAESLSTHQPMGAAMGQLERLRLFDADLVHVFDPLPPRASAPLPAVVGPLDERATATLDAEALGAACRRARRVVCSDDAARAALLARCGLEPERVVVLPTLAGARWDGYARRLAAVHDEAFRALPDWPSVDAR